MTTLTDRTSGVAGEETAQLRGRLRTMTTLVIVLAVALIGLGAWMVFDAVAGSDTAVTGEIQTLLDDYVAAWNDHDGEAFLALVTDGYTFGSGSDVSTAEEQARAIESSASMEFQVEVIGEPIMSGDGPNYYVAQANHTSSSTVDLEGISVFTIAERGDTFLIHSHLFIGGAS